METLSFSRFHSVNAKISRRYVSFPKIFCHNSFRKEEIQLDRRNFLAMMPMVFEIFGEKSKATVLEDVARKYIRPEIETQRALIILLDARSVLKEIQV